METFALGAGLVSRVSQSPRPLSSGRVLPGSPVGTGLAWGRPLRDGDIVEGSVTGLGAGRDLRRAER